MRAGHRAAGVLLAAGLLCGTVTGCSSEADEKPRAAEVVKKGPGAKKTAAPEESPEEPEASEPSGSEGSSESGAPGTGADVPEAVDPPAEGKVPVSELKPATGTFEQKDREYLTNRVPKGMDPAAVLVTGEDTCQRIGRTAEADRKATTQAIADGEIPGAEAAVTHLCPEYADLLP